MRYRRVRLRSQLSEGNWRHSGGKQRTSKGFHPHNLCSDYANGCGHEHPQKCDGDLPSAVPQRPRSEEKDSYPMHQSSLTSPRSAYRTFRDSDSKYVHP